VTILKDEAWTVYFTQKLPVLDRNNPPSSPYKQRIPVAQAETLERALQSADKFVEKRLGDAGMNV
jgi:hypothetical protein